MNDNWKPIVRRKPVRLAVIEGGVPPKPEPCSCGCRGVGVDAAHVPGAKIGPFFSFCRSCGTEGPAAANYDLAIQGWNAARRDMLRSEISNFGTRPNRGGRYAELNALSERLGRPKPP